METSPFMIGFADTFSGIATACQVVHSVVCGLFALGVWKDAKHLTRSGSRTALVSGPVWALATLLTGVTAALAYWAIHHSVLSRKN